VERLKYDGKFTPQRRRKNSDGYQRNGGGMKRKAYWANGGGCAKRLSILTADAYRRPPQIANVDRLDGTDSQ